MRSGHPTGLARARASAKATAPSTTLCTALYPFAPQNSDELGFEAGQTLVLLAREGFGEGWWKGALDGREGVFPANYVRVEP